MNAISNETIMIDECFKTIEESNNIRMTNSFEKLNEEEMFFEEWKRFSTWIDRRHSTENVCLDTKNEIGSPRSFIPLWSCQQTESSSGINVRVDLDEMSFPIINQIDRYLKNAQAKQNKSTRW